MAHRPPDRPFSHAPPPNYQPPFAQQPTAQPPIQMPFSDPFHTSRDPFMAALQHRRGSFGPMRAWPPTTQGNGLTPHHQQPAQPSPQSSHPLLPPPPSQQNGMAHMPLPYDVARRGSLGAAGSPPQYARGPLEPPQPPPPFAARNMPPPSSPQMLPPSSASGLVSMSAPRGPPTTSPFAGIHDIASLPSHRPGAGMSISSILGGGDNRRPMNSPHTSSIAPSSTPKSMQPPSPGRARASSMREELGRREPSPFRGGMFGEPRAQSAFHDRAPSEVRRDGIFASPQFQRESPHSFRAFRPDQEQRAPVNGNGPAARPSSQPLDLSGPRTVDEIIGARREIPVEGRFGTFRHYGEPTAQPRQEVTPRHDAHPFPNGVTSQPREHDGLGSPRMDRDNRQAPMRFPPGPFGNPMREDQAGLFRPAYHNMPEAARESIEARHDFRRGEPRSSPPMSDLGYRGARIGFVDRPMTFEEQQRMDAVQREQQQRKQSDGSGPRSLLNNISPELNRKGRDSPLPQAVQGAQPKHVGPGGDNPGIKMEFGRMFSGLGSGLGSATPVAGQTANGVTTPSRLSPVRHVEDGDLVRTAVGNIEEAKTGSRPKGGKKTGRRSREEERFDGDGRATPDSQRGAKRTKTTLAPHHHHHLYSHHHHHVHDVEQPQGGFGMMRFPSNSGIPQSRATSHPAHHHHHHHHATHAHPAHHHHHHGPGRAAAPSKPAITINTQKVLDQISDKPRRHLGSQLYTTVLSQPANADTALDSKIKYSSNMKPLPLFEDKENCTYTVRVPRYYLGDNNGSTEHSAQASPLEEVCRRRQIWGTEIYTDDSDVIAAAVHSGWLKGDFGEYNNDLRELCDNDSELEDDADGHGNTDLKFNTRPTRPVRPPPDHDLHITILLLPPLEEYVSTMQHHVRSRKWDITHDGMSFMIQGMEFVDEGPSTRFSERGMVAKKQRMALEESRRREAAAGLLMFANSGFGGGTGGSGAVRVGA